MMAGTNQSMNRKACPTATLPTTYLTWSHPRLNLGLHSERMQTKLLKNTWTDSDKFCGIYHDCSTLSL